MSDIVREHIKFAKEMIVALCKPMNTSGSREWIMHIPAQEDDPDLVIGRVLSDASVMVDEIDALHAKLELAKDALRYYSNPEDDIEDAITTTWRAKETLQKLEE